MAVLTSLLGGCTGIVDGKSQGDPAGTQSGSTTSPGSTAQSLPTSTGGTKLRLLTQAEYLASIQSLLGTLSTQLTLPSDTSVGGFISVGAAQVSVGDLSVEQYETASLAATAEVFGDTQRWQTLVGCQPKADLSDACVTTFIQSFGRRAFRRALTDDEVTQWVGVAQNGATLANGANLAGSAALGLAAATSGLLQSPNFLYRVETNKLDAASGRLKYDGVSMASRLSYLLTGGPPSDDLLNSAVAGQLDAVDGVQAAAAQLSANTNADARLAAFFSEFGEVQQVLVVQKDPTLFPNFNSALQASMFQGTQLFIQNVVLGANADVRSFFNSPQTYADATLAPIYGLQAPSSSGFSQVQLTPQTGRAGILGQASVIAAQSQPDRTSPTRRGYFIMANFLCTTPPPPPPGVITVLPTDPTTTTRQKMVAHRASPSCAGCHALMDPLGFGLEHLDPIGQYRATENGLTIDATGTVDGVAFDGAASLGMTLSQDANVLSCMVRSFYRDANGDLDDPANTDSAQIANMLQSLSANGYVWRNLIASFVASDAFRSAPALPLMSASQ